MPSSPAPEQSDPAPESVHPRSGMRFANRVMAWLVGIGVPIGPIWLLTVPGRRSGQPRATPIGPFTVDGQRYAVAGLANADWAENARAAGTGILRRGRQRQRVRLTEIHDPARKRAVMEKYPTSLPQGVRSFQRLGLVSAGTPAEFAAISDRVALFTITLAAG